ncbi:CopG-like ribbon-helix-helix domain-containing protein, partial [Dysosmobacter welbionis]
ACQLYTRPTESWPSAPCPPRRRRSESPAFSRRPPAGGSPRPRPPRRPDAPAGTGACSRSSGPPDSWCPGTPSGGSPGSPCPGSRPSPRRCRPGSAPRS